MLHTMENSRNNGESSSPTIIRGRFVHSQPNDKSSSWRPTIFLESLPSYDLENYQLDNFEEIGQAVYKMHLVKDEL